MHRYLGVAVFAVVQAAAAADLNELKSIEMSPSASGAKVVVTASQTPVFTVFRLSEPDRLVVDVANANVGSTRGHHEGVGPVSGVVASQFSDAKNTVGRVLVGLDGAGKYDVHADGLKLVIAVDSAAKAVTPMAEAAKPAAEVKAEVATAAPVDGVVNSFIDEKKVDHAATMLTGLSYARSTLKLNTNGNVAKFEMIELANPARLAIDLYAVSAGRKSTSASDQWVKEVRVGKSTEKTRVVVEMRDTMPRYKVSRVHNGLTVALSAAERAPTASADDAEVVIDGKPVELAAAPVAASRSLSEVKSIDFKESAEGGRVEIALSAPTAWKVERGENNAAVLVLDRVLLPKSLERSLDTSALQTPVKMVSAFAPGQGNRARIALSASESISDTVVETPNGLSWRISRKATPEGYVSDAKTAGFKTEAVTASEEGAPKKGYIGKRVSFEFKDIDIHNLLRVIAEVSKKNIIVADDVNGKITIRLRNVPWDQALDLILRSKSLGKEDFGNIMRVAPLATLATEEKAREERRKSATANTPLSVALLPVNYATADDMASRAKEILSERGNVTVDTRTNTMIIRDLPENLAKVRSLVASLDTPTPQVLIEARIVEATSNFSRSIGVQWGGQAAMSSGTGNPTGLVFPSSVVTTGGLTGGDTGGVSANPNYAVNLPSGSNGALGFTFGSAGGALALNLRLTAAESTGASRTISAPRVTTLDNLSAKISQGISIPFSQVSAAGAQTSFVEARLSLDVTPHITQDGSVMMKINAQNNQPDPGVTGANGQPAIQRKEAQTNVLVKDGETTVIGGIYTRVGGSNEKSVPILGKIPVIGFFFRTRSENEQKSELLIFITPRILNRQAVAQSP